MHDFFVKNICDIYTIIEITEIHSMKKYTANKFAVLDREMCLSKP